MTSEYLPRLIAESLIRGGDRLAVVAGTRSMSFAELDEQSARVAGWLKANVRSSNVVLVCSHSVDDVVVHVAALRAGKVLVPIDWRESGKQIRDILTLLESDGLLGAANKAPDGVTGYATVGDVVLEGPADLDWFDWSPDDEAWVFFTSGSTGTPRGASTALKRRRPANFMNGAVDERSVVSVARPLSFTAGGNAALATLAMGGQVLLTEIAGQTLDAFLRELESQGATHVTLPTTFVRSGRAQTGLLVNPAIQEVNVAGERCLAEDLNAIRELFPRARIHNSYGSSELGTIARLSLPSDQPLPNDPVPVGQPFQCEVMIVDDLGHRLPPGETGAIVVVGDGRSAGYVTHEGLIPLEETVTADGTRTVATGDAGFLDADGLLYVVGRRDDFVKINGQLVNMGAVQAEVMRHPDVVDAAVAAFESGGGRTRLGAVVQVRAGAAVTSRDIRQFLAGEMASYMIPARMIVGDSIPHGVRGKTDRLRVAEMVSQPLLQSYSGAVGDPITWKIVACLSEFVDTGGVSTTENLQFCGLDSLDAVEFSEMVSQATGVRVPMSLLAGEWSLSSLRDWILGGGDRAGSRVVTMARGSDPLKVLWVMPGTNLMTGMPLASSLAGFTSLGLVHRGTDSRRAPLVGTDAIAHDLFGEFLRRVCDSNTAVIGFSSAAWIAHRLAQLMLDAGIGPRLLVMIDPPTFENLNRLVNGPDAVRLMLAREGQLPFEATDEADQRLLALQIYGLLQQRPGRYEGRSLLILREGRDGHEPGLTEVLRDPTVVRCPGDHNELMRDPSICGPAIRTALVDAARGTSQISIGWEPVEE